MTTPLPPCPGIDEESFVVFPHVTQRFTCGLHPDYYNILGRHEEWVRTKLLPGQREAAEQILADNLSALFVSMSYYRLDTEKVLDVCNLTDWLFFHDNDVARLRTGAGDSDAHRENAVNDYLESLKKMLEGGPAPDEPWAMDSINDLIARFAAKATPEGFTRLVEAFDHYSTVTIGDEATNLLRNQVTDLDSYRHMRAADGSSATIFYHIVTQYVLGLDIDQTALKHESVERYWAAIMDYWYLPNDLLSFRAECARGDHNNAICLLRRTQGATLQEAVDTVARMIDHCQDTAVRHWNEITESRLADVPGLLPLLETFQHIGAANHRWSFMAPRYHGRGFVWNGVLKGELRLTPSHTYFPDVPTLEGIR